MRIVNDTLTLKEFTSFDTLRVGNRIVVPKEKFIEWVMRSTKGGDDR